MSGGGETGPAVPSSGHEAPLLPGLPLLSKVIEERV